MRALLATILLASACSSIRTTELALPPPTGPHAVGTRLFDLADAGRPDVFAGSRVPRRMLVQLFYPAASSGTCTLDAYMDAPTAEAAVQNGSLPAGFALRVKTNSCVNAPVAGDAVSLPVILFSHGLGASRFSYRALCEELASRGYAVAAIQHTYGSTMTYFPDGTRATWNEAAWESPDDLSRYLGEWVKDARFVVDRLALAPFPPQLDRGRLGYAGHSFGGSAAVLTAIRDPRVRAVCNLDGRLFPPIPKPLRLDVPLLALLNESNTRRNDYGTGDDVFLARLRGTTHTTFSDTPWLDAAFHVPDELASKLSTPVRPGEGMRLTREAVVAFFDCTLRGNRSRCAALRDQLAPRDMP